MVERVPVEDEAAGSIPVTHPTCFGTSLEMLQKIERVFKVPASKPLD